MKITFTGISRDDAARKIEAAANKNRAFAARLLKMYPEPDPWGAGLNRSYANSADHLDALARVIKSAETDTVSISIGDERSMYHVIREGLRTFEDVHSLYQAMPETDEEREALSLEFNLAQGTHSLYRDSH